MTKFLTINLIIFIIAIFLSKNLAAEETILPKPQPRIEELSKKEIILPKSLPKNAELQKEEASQIELQSNIDKTLKEKLILPKNKPIISDLLKLQAKQKKFLLPKKKPEDKAIDQPIILEKEKEKESIEEKVVAIIDDKKLIFPKKKPLIYKEPVTKKITKSKHFSKHDLKLAKKVFSEIEKKRWTSAQNLSKGFENRTIYKLVKWLYLLEPNNQAGFYQYINFINLHPNFPRLGRLRYLAEHKITTETIKEKRIIQWFEEKEPHSGYGKLMLGQSYLIEDNLEKGISLIKNGWITASLSKRDLKYLKKKLKKYLNTEDHIKRADWLAWENKYWDLKRMLRYLPKDYQALYNARLY